jgi:ABC-type branched-subunit amino acid transport system ATPase component
MTTPEKPSFAVRDVTVQFSGITAVDAVSVDFPAGQVTGIIGPNGAGKTSLMNVMAGSLRPARGHVRLGGTDITRLPPHKRARHGLIRSFQHARVFGSMSALDNLMVGLPRQTGDRLGASLLAKRRWLAEEQAGEARALELLRAFQLEEHAATPCSQLSGGQKRIIEYLRSLMAQPAVLLLDEPTVGLAPWVVKMLSDDLRRLAADGTCVVLIEHEMDVIKSTCDSIVGMAMGRVVVRGSFAEITENEVLQSAYLGKQ